LRIVLGCALHSRIGGRKRDKTSAHRVVVFLQSFEALTYRSVGQQGDSRRIWQFSVRGASMS
jgi:hypothetical protein